MAIITERGRWANSTVDERGRRIFANGLDERGRKVFGLNSTPPSSTVRSNSTNIQSKLSVSKPISGLTVKSNSSATAILKNTISLSTNVKSNTSQTGNLSVSGTTPVPIASTVKSNSNVSLASSAVTRRFTSTVKSNSHVTGTLRNSIQTVSTVKSLSGSLAYVTIAAPNFQVYLRGLHRSNSFAKPLPVTVMRKISAFNRSVSKSTATLLKLQVVDNMIEIIRFKRGNKANLPSLQLGEPAITQDTNELYVGMTSGNVKIPTQPDLDSVNTSLAEIAYNASNTGAKADGVTDDSTALTNWLNSSYNVISLLPNKTYYITSPITVTELNNKIIIGNGATIKYKGLEASSVGNGGILNFVNCNNISIRDLTIDVNTPWMARPYSWDTTNYNNYLAQRGKTKDSFYFDTCDNVRLTNCKSLNCRVAFFLTSVTNSTISGCLAKQTMADSYYIVGASKHIVVEGCHVQDGGDDCFSADGFELDPTLNPSYITFVGCTVKNTGGALVCLLGSNYTQIIGCVGEGIRYIPVKLGYLLNGSNVINGHDQYVKDCIITCTDQIDDSGGNSGSVTPIFINAKDQTNMTNCYNLNVEGTTIQKLGTTVVPLYVRYSQRFKIKDCRFINFNFKMDFAQNYDFENNYIETPSFTILTSNTDGRIKDNYINNLSATDNTVLWLSEGNQMVIKNNKLVCANPSATEQLDLYSGTSCNDFKLSNNGNKVMLTNANNVQCDGVFMDYFSAPYNRFVVGQIVYDNTASTMKLVTATGYKTFTVA